MGVGVSKRFTLLFLCILSIGAFSCNGNRKPLTDDTSAQANPEIEVLDIAIRTDLLSLNEADKRDSNSSLRPVFIATGCVNPITFQPPPEELIKRLSDLPIRVLSVASCDTTGWAYHLAPRFVENGTNVEGVLLLVTISKWVTPAEVEIQLSRRGPLTGGGYSLRMVKSGSKWIVVARFDVWVS